MLLVSQQVLRVWYLTKVLDKGDYTSMTVGDISYSVINDRRIVCFAM